MLLNDPIITSSSDVCQNLTIQNGGVLTSNNGSYKLTTASITVNDGGSLVISNGEVESSGDADFSGDLTMSGGLLDVDGEFDMLSTGDGRNISDGNITAKKVDLIMLNFFNHQVELSLLMLVTTESYRCIARVIFII